MRISLGKPLNQSKIKPSIFDDIEVIFVDDKSSDNSVEVIQKFVDEYDNVKLFITPEGHDGLSFSRNWSMEPASADYIAFLDSDDKLGPEYIESTYNEMVENDVDIVKTAFVVGFDKKMSYSQNWEGLLCLQTTSLH